MSLPAPGPDRACLVTGASSGIGVEIARNLASRGHQVVLVARSEDRLEAVADGIRSEGGTAYVVPADLGDRTARAELLDRVTALGVDVDVLVNNAGFSTLGRVAEADPVDEMAMVEVDVVAVLDLCTRFVPGMVARGRGGVLNVASTAAFQPLPGQAGYGAGKAFVLSYSQSLAGELKGTGVTATCLCPGPVATGFGERAGFAEGDFDSALPKVMWVSPEEVAACGVEALDKGRLSAIPGLANRVGARMSQVAPRRVLVELLTRVHPATR
ncbi:SDR family oxidoreductase [Nocardioides sp. HDW12B]|uniref:SDR family NAD(P)-dependent oxidoreductase n=1 Tax=Nocardioides sp. HDW12B TaxID=2714939 RepID=UPI00140DE99B|nr:SDR family oxidoreductase [Nocardioides sp. HDW12B]QIK66542.1 SDR family oxidoreductase [Nocardioides sp. HDW12B]